MVDLAHDSEPCLERPLPSETTCHEDHMFLAEGPTFSPKTTCLERPYFYG